MTAVEAGALVPGDRIDGDLVVAVRGFEVGGESRVMVWLSDGSWRDWPAEGAVFDVTPVRSASGATVAEPAGRCVCELEGSCTTCR